MSAKVMEVMTKNVVAVHTSASFKEIAATLHDRRVSAFPVLDGRLAGIISRTDVLSVFSRADTDIRHEIIQTILLERFLTDPASVTVTVTVTDGIVTLEGTPETASLGHDIVRAVRHLEGVVAVRDRLSDPAPAEYVPVSGPLF